MVVVVVVVAQRRMKTALLPKMMVLVEVVMAQQMSQVGITHSAVTAVTMDEHQVLLLRVVVDDVGDVRA